MGSSDWQLELFARKLARGLPYSIAFTEAGLTGDDGAAEALSKDKDIQARAAKFKATFPKVPVQTKQEQIARFEEARLIAMSRLNPSAAIVAILKKLPLHRALAEDEYEIRKRLETERLGMLEIMFQVIERDAKSYEDDASAQEFDPDPKADDPANTCTLDIAFKSRLFELNALLKPDLTRSLAVILAGLVSELEHVRDLAMELGKATAAAKAISEQIKLYELMEEQALNEENDFARRSTWL